MNNFFNIFNHDHTTTSNFDSWRVAGGGRQWHMTMAQPAIELCQSHNPATTNNVDAHGYRGNINDTTHTIATKTN